MKKKYKYVGKSPTVMFKWRHIVVYFEKGTPVEIDSQDLIKQLDTNSNFEEVKTKKKTKKKEVTKENGKI